MTGCWLTIQKSIPFCYARNKSLEVEMFTKTERKTSIRTISSGAGALWFTVAPHPEATFCS